MRFKTFIVAVLGISSLVPMLEAKECCSPVRTVRVNKISFLQRLRNRRTRSRPKSTRYQCCPAPVATHTQPVLEPNSEATSSIAADPPQAVEPAKAESKWRTMFNGKDLGDWKITEFGGEGDVFVEDGLLKLGFGQYLTGVTYKGKDLPTNNYEIEVEAMREDGLDFFCGLTFPVEESHCSLIAGGWGGSVVGISSIDDMDASENNTTSYIVFKNEQWYKFRVRVTPGRLKVWIDDEDIIDEDVEGRKLSTRIEVDRSMPLGVAAFDTQAAIRSIRIRELDEAEIQAGAAD